MTNTALELDLLGLALDGTRHARPRPVRVAVAVTILDHPLDALCAAGGSGWICFRDTVLRVRDARRLPGPDAYHRPEGRMPSDPKRPLSAELFDSNGESRSLRQADGRWRLANIREVDSGGDEALAFDERLIAARNHVRPEGACLCYRVYWKRDADGVWCPWAAAFRGFSEDP